LYDGNIYGATLFGDVVVLESSSEEKYICPKCLKKQKKLKKINEEKIKNGNK
jgi:ribosomal protein L37AE/L43A